ncbi:hypothetical protein FQN54_007757 [Arachnomyces sp. PD_36]|nr:hypothetical protein FQN54_007757 [Arachnomyces sp. PD_36]
MVLSAKLSRSLLESIIAHILLPPKLPGRQDTALNQIEKALATYAVRASSTLRDILVRDDSHTHWDSIRNLLQTCLTLNSGRSLDHMRLVEAFGTLRTGHPLILHVAEQNAGLLIRKEYDKERDQDIIIFESFEASPLSEQVLAAQGALQWDFPTAVVALPSVEFDVPALRTQLAGFLQQASIENISKFTARAKKGGYLAMEPRETVDPSMITEVLTTLLEANGYRTAPTYLRKRVRDDVCWAEGTEKPWRRSPFWLVLRAGLGMHLATIYGPGVGRVYYKMLLSMVLALIIEDAVQSDVGPELLVLLNAKLGRRLTKLQGDLEQLSPGDRTIYGEMFSKLHAFFLRSLETSKKRVEIIWNSHKKASLKPIRPLPLKADAQSLVLSLPSSSLFLQQTLTQASLNSLSVHQPVSNKTIAKKAHLVDHQYIRFSEEYCKLAELEDEISRSWATPEKDHQSYCNSFANAINSYLKDVGELYDSNPEQKSTMLLTVMKLWVALDKCAVETFDLLEKYDPGIPANMLDVLQLSSLEELADLQQIQDYLNDRRQNCEAHGKTIFCDPTGGCFAERYFDDSKDSVELQELFDEIVEADKVARERKFSEWVRQTAEYERMHKQMVESTCLYSNDRFRVVHDDRNCTKCQMERQTRNMRIEIHEEPLPESMVHAKAVVFELRCPKAFRLYRDTTWKIIGYLGRPEIIDSRQPRALLREYSGLQAFLPRMPKEGVSLASTTKPYLFTHYRSVSLPVNWDNVCLPNGLKLGYYDSGTRAWTGRQNDAPSFSHHCQMTIPRDSPFAALHKLPQFAVGSVGPSSYEIVASQTECPTGLGLHEFMAYQALLSGTARRWPTILIELGSSNLNFSAEATSLLVSQLVMIAGPAEKHNILRSTHRILHNHPFCNKLLEVVQKRIQDLSSSWRESHGMSMLIVILQRLYTLGFDPIPQKALELLVTIRGITIGWIRKLRGEINRCTDATTSSTCSRYALWAAILCRKTFFMLCNPSDTGRDMEVPLKDYIESSLALQENMPSNLASLSRPLTNALVCDAKMVFRMRFVLERALTMDPDALVSTINSIWQQSEETQIIYQHPKFLTEPYHRWVQWCLQADRTTKPQTFHFHLLDGHLLVDGQPVGRLPQKYLKSVVLQQLFGKQSLSTYPSNLPGMTYMLAFPMYKHQVHFTFRDNQLIIQALYRGAVLELIPPAIFKSADKWDLPVRLVDNCCHWLNLKDGILEIRRQPNIWRQNDSNWRLDVNMRMAYRRSSLLVDPHSQLFDRVAAIFRFFELPGSVTVYQPGRRNLCVELRRLELSFFVNKRGLLRCRQLPCVIDEDQDAGTWYGLRSKLVLRDVFNRSQRSIIVPLGHMSYARDGCHVTIDVENDGTYGRFVINDVLGRLECPAEPRLLYSKIMFHAYTSFVLPDRLTGLTGTEEALRGLSSGYCQPWVPLSPGAQEVLTSIAKLTPRREYYPMDMNFMQQVYWDSKLTVSIQHEDYRSLVLSICEMSQTLALFAIGKTPTLEIEFSETSSHLGKRGAAALRRYKRPITHVETEAEISDLPYNGRGRPKSSRSRSNAYEVASLLRNWKPDLYLAGSLATILQTWPTIGGYGTRFQKTLLGDLLQVDLGLEWGPIATLCQTSSERDKYQLMFSLAVMAFQETYPMEVIRCLIAFAVSEDLKAISCPQWPSYTHFKHNQAPTIDYIQHLLQPFGEPYPGDERTLFPGQIATKMRRKLELAERNHNQQVESDCKALAEFLIAQWPCQELTIEGFSSGLLVNAPEALEKIQPEWLRLFRNFELSQHIDEVQRALNFHRVGMAIGLPKLPTLKKVPFEQTQSSSLPALADLIKGSTRMTLAASDEGNPVVNIPTGPKALNSPGVFTNPGTHAPSNKSEISELKDIVSQFTDSDSLLEKRYGKDLLQSLEALVKIEWELPADNAQLTLMDLKTQIFNARLRVQRCFYQLKSALDECDYRSLWLQAGSLWPPVTHVTLLEQLRSTSKVSIPPKMKERLIGYAVSITSLQRLLRMEDAMLKRDDSRLLNERQNLGHSNWEPADHLDWLLLEIDSNMLIRKNQVDVAVAMMSPASSSNSALQMNMGQGKTSCIIPMVVAELADTKKLVRVIVPKALLLQTAQVLQTRLGGLLGREVRHVPFARKTTATTDTMRAYHQIHNEIKASCGVMVTLPEHVLSFKLSGLQRLSDNHLDQAKQMVKIQKWLEKVCRDILDECDYTLSSRTQLIYPSGTQATVDGHPHRWEIAQILLHAVEGHLWNLHLDFPFSIEVVQRPQGGFPMVFFLRRDVEQELVNRLVTDILDSQIPVLPTKECSVAELDTIRQFISVENLTPQCQEDSGNLFRDKPTARQALHLLRGLLVHRILLLSLKKRWNVQYGLHPLRDPIAVPYHSKGVPSEQAEWGHLDVAILLTCLAFYFAGLECDQLRQSLEHVLKSDDPASGYDRWTHQSETLPDSLREWNVINVEDPVQMNELWTYLRYNVVVIDYHLNHFVFPAHAKQFKFKLQASGWDIPIAPIHGDGFQTTGFSGTNDNRVMLPLTIQQDDLPGLRHTNAEVLTYLLQPRNRQYLIAADTDGRHITERNLLEMLWQRNIRILIDAGAQILEMDNLSLVQEWMKVDIQAPAAVFFNQENKASVWYRHGTIVPLVASSYAEDLSECLVYLDEAHTRGTDLKLPPFARGALTLSLGQTKDHTVQAAMRLRQLGSTQSITWVSPPEVHQSIIDFQEKGLEDSVDSYDVICWLLKQTCVGMEQLQPLYFSQGVDFCRRTEAAITSKEFLSDNAQRKDYLEVLRCAEQQTLEELYGLKGSSKPGLKHKFNNARIKGFMAELQTRRKGFQDFGNAVHGSVLQEVEQEREVAFEVEAVRQVQKPVHYVALRFPGLDDGILKFVMTGLLEWDGKGWEAAHTIFGRTDLGRKLGVNETRFRSKLYVSKEFMRTVVLPGGRANDDFLRPINWLLWSTVSETAMVIIPEEVEVLLPILQGMRKSPTHLVTYAAPVTRGMMPFNDLKYFTIPALARDWKPPKWLVVEIGLLSGRLYFNFNEYEDICGYFGASIVEEIDEAIEEQDNKPNGLSNENPSFSDRPLSFLQQWLSVRRKGQDFTHTPMGYVCQSKALTSDHPFFSSTNNQARTNGRDVQYRPSVEETADDAEGDFDSDIDHMYDDDDDYYDVDE